MARRQWDVEMEAGEGAGVFVGADSVCGRDQEKVFQAFVRSGSAMPDYVREGVYVPFMQKTGTGFTARVVLGALHPLEAEEWVLHAAWKLRLPDARLAVSSGPEILERNRPDGENPHLQVLPVPAGDYRIDGYGYLPEAIRDFDVPSDESLGQWFERTRRGEPPPDWVGEMYAGDEETFDPEAPEKWESRFAQIYRDLDVDQSMRKYLSYVFQLTPLATSEPLREVGFKYSCLVWTQRKPARFPLGILFRP